MLVSLGAGFEETGALPIVEAPLVFHFLVVAPSEELMFRFFLPLTLMFATGLGYLAAGVVASVAFALAHWWAYQANIQGLTAAFLAGVAQCLVVYFYGRTGEALSFSPGLLSAILGHATYNCVVSMAPHLLLPLTLAYTLAFTALKLSSTFTRREP